MSRGVVLKVHIDLSAFFATMLASVGGFFISKVSRSDSKVVLQLGAVLVLAGTVYVSSEVIGDWLVTKFGEQIHGLWIEDFAEPPTSEQLYSVAFIHFNNSGNALGIEGYGYAADGRRISEWRSVSAVPNEFDASVHYLYRGKIDGIDGAIDGTGLIHFHRNPDPQNGLISFGTGEFREEYSAYKRFEYELKRLDAERLMELVQKKEVDSDDYPDVIRAYHRAKSAKTGRPTLAPTP